MVATLDFESFVATIIKEKFAEMDETAADAREQQGIAQKGLGNRVISNTQIKTDALPPAEKTVSTATRVLNDMSDPLYYQPDEFPTQEVRVDRAPRFSNINRSTVLDILSANRDGLEKQGIVKMPMGMLRKPDPTLDIDGLQSRILDKLDLRPPEGSVQDIQYGLDSQKLGEPTDDEDQPDIKFDTPDSDSVDAIPKPELGGLMAPKGRGSNLVFAQAYLGVKVDNKFGPGTSRALAAFQYRNNIPVSGQVDDETIKAMQNPDTLDPREATINLSDVLNAEGTHPDIEKLKDWAKKNIKDPLRAAAFVATVEAESEGLGIEESSNYRKKEAIAKANKSSFAAERKRLVEAIWNNPSKTETDSNGVLRMTDAAQEEFFNIIYNDAYRDASGKLGNTQEGDGYRYRGRGIIQITGRDNYKKIGDILNIDLENNPDLALDSRYTASIAMAYLTLPGKNFFLNKMRDGTKIDELTSEKLAEVVGHGGGTAEARNRFRRATDLKREMYN